MGNEVFREVGYGVCFFVSALTGAVVGPIVLLWHVSQLVALPHDATSSGVIALAAIAIGTISGSAVWFGIKYGWLEKRRKKCSPA